MLYGIACSVCKRRGLAPVDESGELPDRYVSRHGWALCTLHADTHDPRWPDEPLPIPFAPDPDQLGNVAPMRGRRR